MDNKKYAYAAAIVRAEVGSWPDWKKELANEYLTSANAKKIKTELVEIRRFDDLGRIPIPKHIRAAINNGQSNLDGVPYEISACENIATGEKYIKIALPRTNTKMTYDRAMSLLDQVINKISSEGNESQTIERLRDMGFTMDELNTLLNKEDYA